ncbi:ankyrin [Xylaria scruposa]|nr:ankyrin [Xylaria scruposa]
MSAQLAPVGGPAQRRDFSLFEQHRSLLRRLYLEEGKSSAQVKKEMETYYGFPEIDAKIYEYAWRHMGFFKKLSIEEWIRVYVRVKKRKEREGKETEVFLSGVRQPPKKIHRIISRNPKSDHLQYRIRREPTLDCPDGVLLKTPPRSPNMTVTNLEYPTYQVPFESLDMSIVDSETGDSLDFEQLSDRVRKLMISNPDSVVHWLAHAPSSQLILASRQCDGVKCIACHGQEFRIPDPFNLPWDSAFRIPAQRHFLGALGELSMIFANNQEIKATDHRRLLSWIGADTNKSVLENFFTQDLVAMVATWAQLVSLSAKLKSGEAFETLVEVGFTTHGGEWIRQHVDILVKLMIELGSEKVRKIARRLFSDEHVRAKARQSNVSQRSWHVSNGEQLDFEMISEFNLAGITFDALALCELFRWSTRSPYPVESTQQLFNLLKMAGYNFDRHISYLHFHQLVVLYHHRWRWTCDDDFVHPSLCEFFCELDYLWFIAGHDIYEAILSHSRTFKNRMAIVGLILAAREGIEDLSLYLNSIPSEIPSDTDSRRLFLELAFTMAAGLGDVAAIRSFVEGKIDLNAHMLLSKTINQVDWHPLMRAIGGEQWEVVRMLVEMGAELRSEIKFFNPLSAAICTPRMKPLSDSKRLGQLEIIRYFIDKDLVDVYGADAMIKAVVPPHYRKTDAFIPDEEVVGMLLEAGVEIDEIMEDGKNILHLAIDRGCNLETVEFLISRGAQIHSQPCPRDGKTMLHSAAASYSKDRQKIVELLVYGGADCTTEWGGPTILESALSIRNKGLAYSEESLQMFAFLLDRGAQLNGPEVRLPGVKNAWTPIVTLLLFVGAPDALIYKTIQEGTDIKSVGVCIHVTRSTPLQYAIYKGRQAVARHLITRGVDINAPAEGDFGRTALQAACNPEAGVEISLGLIQFLLDKGADINAPGAKYGATALQCTIRNGSTGAFCLLLDAGAKIFDTAKFSKANPDALSTAAGYGRLDMVDMMLKKLARSDNQVMRLCKRARREAEKQHHFAIVKTLNEFIGANRV